MTTPATDEFNLIQAWQKLHTKYKVLLFVCTSAALRRGIVEDKENFNIKKSNIACFFQLTGLVELAYSIKICDRIIQF